MIRSGRDLADGAEIRTSLCIVGAGPAGITIADRCAKAGVDLCLIERGAEDPGPGTQDLAVGEIVGQPYYPLETTRVMALGGSSNHWNVERGMRTRPLDAIDFEARPEIPYSGWPFGLETLEPYYQRAHDACGLGPRTYAVADWEDDVERPRIPLPDSSIVTSVFRFGPRDIFRHRAREVARSEHVDLLLHATAFDLVPTEAGGGIGRLDVMTDPGRKFSVIADRYVLAAGGLENARLLLLSRREDFRGIGNEHGLLGRFFMEHISVQTGLVKFHDPSFTARLGLYLDHRARTQTSHSPWLIRAKLGLSPEVVRREGILNSTFFVTPVSAARASDGVRGLKRFRDGFTVRPKCPAPAALLAAAKDSRGLATFAIERLGYRAADPAAVVLLHSIAEQAPNPDSRVVLGTSRDRLGLPVARLDWRLTDLDRFSIRRAHEIIDTELRRAGLGWMEEKLGEESSPPVFAGNWHHMGTTRMHSDPRQGVVDADGAVHGVGNLHVAGSSVFPTGGYANPTLTIVALALRLADHLVKRL